MGKALEHQNHELTILNRLAEALNRIVRHKSFPFLRLLYVMRERIACFCVSDTMIGLMT
jgi:hypothetical protein